MARKKGFFEALAQRQRETERQRLAAARAHNQAVNTAIRTQAAYQRAQLQSQKAPATGHRRRAKKTGGTISAIPSGSGGVAKSSNRTNPRPAQKHPVPNPDGRCLSRPRHPETVSPDSAL